MAGAELQIGKRAYQEAMRICESAAVANKMIGCNSKGHVYKWNEGVAPSAKYLQRLHYMGADVIYILTGRRTSNELPVLPKRENSNKFKYVFCFNKRERKEYLKIALPYPKEKDLTECKD